MPSVPAIDHVANDAVAGHGSARGFVAISLDRPIGSHEEDEVSAVAVGAEAVLATKHRQLRSTRLKEPSAPPLVAALLNQHPPSHSTCTVSSNSMTSSLDGTNAMVMAMLVKLRAGSHTPATGEGRTAGTDASRTGGGGAATLRNAPSASPRSNSPASWASPPRVCCPDHWPHSAPCAIFRKSVHHAITEGSAVALFTILSTYGPGSLAPTWRSPLLTCP